ncbi:hypothetical protein BGZ91_003707 [Linnemannia elongata]|nr:hypothetical protein BGZ91_003707 [Linnemannia elongata]
MSKSVCKDKGVVAAKHTPDIAAYLDDTEEADDMYYDNPSEALTQRPTPMRWKESIRLSTEDLGKSRALLSLGAHSNYAIPPQGCCLFAAPSLNSPKWLLESGAVVKDFLLQAGLGLSVDHFMVDLKNKYTESLFSSQNWTEIITNLPASGTSST